MEGKDGWIGFLGLVIILCLLYSAYAAFQLSISHVTWKLMIFILGLVLLFIAFWQIGNIKELETIFQGYMGNANNGLDSAAYLITFILAIAAIILLIFLFVINAKSITAAYMVFGMFFIILAGLQILATGKIFRNYRRV